MAEKYLPLYRKYRPSSFKEVVGQEVVVKTLLNAISHERVAHAYLFCGPRGTGKTSIARIFAKTLNCLELKDGIPCGKCAHCLDMNNTISMDVIEIDAASNRKVEDARNLLEKVQFTPVLGKNKIYIIDEVHMLTTEAFNTLLKTLEEPPENLVFILATTESHKVMETIVSRCQKFDFRRISVEDIKNRLKYVATTESISIEDDAIEFIARKSAGGLRDALALLDQSTVLALENKSITKKDIITLLGSVDDEDLFNLAEFIAKKETNGVITLLKGIVDKGNDPNQIMKELIAYFRNLMLASVCKDVAEASKLLDISQENCERILKQSQDFSSLELVQIIEELSAQERNVRNSTNPYLWLDVAIVSVSARENVMAQKALLERIENLENASKQGFQPRAQIQTQPVQTLKATPASQVAPTPQPKVEEIKQTSAPTSVAPKQEVAKIVEAPKAEPVEQTPTPAVVPAPTSQTAPTPVAAPAPEPAKEMPEQSGSTITLVWETFLGELNSKNPVLFALVKTHARPIILTSDKIELAFRNDVFVEKVNQKRQTLEDVAKNLCGKIPQMIFRKISDDDFKKKLSTEPQLTQAQPQTTPESALARPVSGAENLAPQRASNEPDIGEPSVDELTEIVTSPPKAPDASLYDLSDQTRQVIEVFSGKVID